MATQMQLANRAWRNVTRQKGWRIHGGSTKKWKAFCRDMALVTVCSTDKHFASQSEANDAVIEEISYWGDVE